MTISTHRIIAQVVAMSLIPFIVQCKKKSGDEDIADLGLGEEVIVVSGDAPADGAPTVQVTTTKDGGTTTTFGAVAPASFNIKGPSETASLTPQITWEASNGAVEYSLKIAYDQNCTTTLIEQTGIKIEQTSDEQITWEATENLINNTYYICVQAINSIGVTQANNNGYTMKVEVEGNNPIATLNSLDAWVNANELNPYSVSGTCDNGIIVVTGMDNASHSDSKSVACNGGTFSADLDLSSLDDGSITIMVQKGSTIDAQSVTKDTIAPNTSAPADDVIATNSKTWNWGCNDTCTYRWVIDSNANTDPTGSFGADTTVTHSSGNGNVYLHLQSMDEAGNISTTSHSLVLMDTIAPNVAFDSVTAIIPSNENSFSISGTCDEGSGTVSWSVDDQGNGGTSPVSGSTSCNGSTWSQTGINLSSLGEGTLDFSVSLPDTAGNAATNSTTAVKDTIAPLLAITSAGTVNSVNALNYGFSGTCNEASGTVNWSIDDPANGGTAAVTGAATCNGTNWAATGVDVSSLDEATLSLIADLDDAYGNSATQASASPLKNTTAPALGINSPADVNNANKASFSMGGICDVNTATVVWSIDDTDGGTTAISGTAVCDGSNWSESGINLASLTDGTLTITADMDDLSSNPAPTETASMPKDVVAPTLGFSAISAANTLNETGFSFGGACNEAGGTVAFSIDDPANGGTAAITGSAACDGTTWSAVGVDVSSLDDSTLNFTADLDDAVGNSASQASSSALKDTIIPTVSVNAPAVAGPSNQATWSITGSCSEDTETVSVTADDQANVGTAAITNTGACSTGSFTILLNVSTLDDGTLNVDVDHSDGAGNPAVTASTTGIHDTTPPAVPDNFTLKSPVSNLSNDTTPELRWTGITAGETIRVWSDITCDTELDNAISAGTTLSIILTLSGDATYQFWATSEDDLGNRSACSSTSVTYTLDTTLSTISAITLQSPASSPGNDATPSVTVDGVGSGDTVKLFSSANCFASEQLGFVVSAGTSVIATVDPGKFTSDGSYNIHARSYDDAGNVSGCSAISAAYTLDTAPPSAPTGLSRVDPTATLGIDTQPKIGVTGQSGGALVYLYLDSGCTNQIGSGTTASFETNVLPGDATYTFYATQFDAAGNESACSAANVQYTLDISNPTLSSVAISSAGGAAVAGVGAEAILTFEASETLSSTTVTILGNPVTAINVSGNIWEARYKFTGGDTSANPVTFSISYTDNASNGGGPNTTITEGSNLVFNDSLYSPEFALSDQVVSENATVNYDINDANTGNDTVVTSGSAITYSCYYDTTVDGVVATGSTCDSLTGMSIVAGTGAFAFSPDYFQSGIYEVRVVGSDGTTMGEDIFLVTVNNVNRLPSLSNVNNRELLLADQVIIDMSDTNTGNDTDIDLETITYSCVYDTIVDGSVTSSDSCDSLDGIDFNQITGYFAWTVQPTTPGAYEFKISGSDGIDSDDEIWTGTVTIDISRLPQLAMVGTNDTSYIVSLADDNEATFNGAPIGGGGTPTIYSVGDLFTVTASAGDLLECTGGCFAITPVEGTAAWSTQTYSSTLLSTYVGRYNYSKIAIAAFDQPASITIEQATGNKATGTIAANSVEVFEINNDVGSLWIQSDVAVSAYISTSNTAPPSASYTRDGRVITAAAKEGLAFVSGAGGTPSGVSTTEDVTTVSAYRNDGTNFLSQVINISDILVVTHTSASQNAAASAIAVEADKPVVVTQHADSDGTNATPSLPKSMLQTNFITPLDGDYVSFASYEPGEVIMLDNLGAFVSRTTMTRDPTAHAKAPYAYSYNPASIPQQYRFICTTPCIGIFEPLSGGGADDETLMTGTILHDFELAAAAFSEGDVIPNDYKDGANGCSGDNDFPEISWDYLPWGTQKVAIIVEDTSNSDFVHLNLVDIDPTTDGFAKIEGVAGAVTFPSGIEGTNGHAATGWNGPCQTTGEHTYKFTIFALTSAIGSAVNNTTSASFATTYASQILGSATLTGRFTQN